ncbi:MAG: DsrE family protein [Bacteroidales bacterium]|nr:DsrE family protein [Bacteroidales bacterium]
MISCNTADKEIKKEVEIIKTEVSEKDGMFLHVSSNDPHRVLMALRMAELMAEDHDVMIYFDIRGIEVVLKDAPDLTYAQFSNSHAQLIKLAEMGIPLQACPGCLEAAGKTADDLTNGVTVADKEKFFSFTKGRILTLDY